MNANWSYQYSTKHLNSPAAIILIDLSNFWGLMVLVVLQVV